jgi:hypothetical protein
MTETDKAHTILGIAGLTCTTAGAAAAWGFGYGLLVLGGVLLAGVVYARTRT